MKRSLIVLLTLLVGSFSHAATTQPATTQSLEQALVQHKLEQKLEYLNQLRELPELKLPTGQISDIFEFTIEKDLLMVRPKLPGTNGQVRCTVKGLDGLCS